MNWLRNIGISKFNLVIERYLNVLNRKISSDIFKNSELLYDAHTAERIKPRNLIPRDEKVFENAYSFQLKKSFLFKVKKAIILYNFIFTRRELFSYAPYFHIRGLTIKGLSKLRMLFYPVEKIPKGIWITDNWSFNYFHWFLDALPKLLCAEAALDGHVLILPDELKNHKFVLESLPYFRVPIKFSDFSKQLHVGELLLPSYLALSGNFNKEVMRKLRERFISPYLIAPYRKIYISREKAHKRKIINETELTSFLRQEGFEIHCFEDYNLNVQIGLMKETKCLIGLHGAGLANMLFMQPQGKILELRNDGGTILNWFCILASDLEQEYYYLLSKGNSPESHLSDLIVDINELKKIKGFFDQ